MPARLRATRPVSRRGLLLGTLPLALAGCALPGRTATSVAPTPTPLPPRPGDADEVRVGVFLAAGLLLGLLPVAAFLHALCFSGRGLALLCGVVALLTVGMLACMLVGRLLPAHVLTLTGLWLLPAVLLSLAAMGLGAYTEGDNIRVD